MSTSLAHTVLVVGGNGFLGSSISKHALAKGWKVISISPTGKPYVSPAGHRPAWSSSPNIEWHAADALDPDSYAHLAKRATAAVHTVGILLESDYKHRADKGPLDLLAGAVRGVAKGWGLAINQPNPLAAAAAKSNKSQSYEVMNRDTAVQVAATFLHAQADNPNSTPAPFVYISAEDLFRPIVDPRYISTKRQAEAMIALLAHPPQQPAQAGNPAPLAEVLSDSDGAGLGLEMAESSSTSPSQTLTAPSLRPIFIRPGLMYHPHTRPISTLPAALLEASAAFHKSPPLPLPLPTPAALLSSSLAPASLRPLAKLLTTPPLHIDTVAKAVCKAIEDPSVHGAIDVAAICRLAGWKEDGAPSPAPATEVPGTLQTGHRPSTTEIKRPPSPFASVSQPHHRSFSTSTSAAFFGLPDLGKLAADTLSAAQGTSGGSSDGQETKSYTDKQGRQVYEAEKVINLPHKALFKTVADVSSYDQFVPYCKASTMLGSDGAGGERAELKVGFGSFTEAYTSQVRKQDPDWVTAQAEQPNPVFEHLTTTWSFRSIDQHNTHVHFHLAYKFRNPLYAAVAGGVFERMSSEMMGAFEKRASSLLRAR